MGIRRLTGMSLYSIFIVRKNILKMDDISLLPESDVLIEKRVRTNYQRDRITERNIYDPAIDNLTIEGEENFYNYLDWLGLANDSDMLVLPSSNHYYYDSHDLEGVTTLINMRKLNFIRHLDDFIRMMYNVLSPSTNFIGCFADRKTDKKVNLASRLYSKLINFLDLRTDLEIDKRHVSQLLQSHGFKIIDMTEIDGLTYFRTQNKKR
jgi:hypothetical protein